MFDLKDASDNISVKDLLTKISEKEIWVRYCTNFEEIDKSFCSELYKDNNPDCRIYYNKINRLVYKDFGNGESHDCFSYIQTKYHCTFKESLRIIYNDFKLGSIVFDIIPQLVLNNAPDVLKIDNKANIEVISKPWNYIDAQYWGQYEIPLTLLDDYDVCPCSVVYIHKKGKTIEFRYTNKNPIYAYKFVYDGVISYKIYFPYADKKHKWLFSGGSENNIEGYDNLPHFADILILTKSLKDCICYNMIGLPAISLQGETNKLKEDLVNKLKYRFKQIIVNYDDDEAGHKAVEGYYNDRNIFIIGLKQQYGFPYFYCDGEKDLSDFIKTYDLNSAKEMINNKLNEINEIR